MRPITEKFEITSGGNIYNVRATEYMNGSDELRYRVSYNDNPVCVFSWNEVLNRFTVMHDPRNPAMHTEIENAIAGKLERIQALREAA